MQKFTLVAAAAAVTLAGGPASAGGAARTKVKVVKVVDGDTVRVATKRAVRKIHLAGIDAPSRRDCLGEQARRRLRSLLPRNARVVVRRREVLRRGRSANVAMVRAGLARATRPPTGGMRRRLRAARRIARKRERGMFAVGVCEPVPSPPPPTTPPPTMIRPDMGTPSGSAPPPPPPPPSPLTISSVSAETGTESAVIAWRTNEPASSSVDYGVTASYGERRSDGRLVTDHVVSLDGLRCARTYHYRATSVNAAAGRATSDDLTFTTRACGQNSGPVIDVWYGEAQRFGDRGFPQRWLNILGEADDADGLGRIDYRLDGGPPITVVHSPAGNPRIDEYGDFNIQLDRTLLAPGRHDVTVTASDALGNESTRVVEVNVAADSISPLPFQTDWQAGIQQAGQVVDGHWTVVDDGVRTVAPGYDRNVAIGSDSWEAVDVTVPVTVHSLSASTSHSGVGVAAGWRGHEGGGSSPWTGWPVGGLCIYHRPGALGGHRLWLLDYPWSAHSSDGRRNWLELGTRYMFRMQAKPIDADSSQYSCKLWRAADSEPSAWGVSAVMPRQDGSVLLLADHADVTFGPAVVQPVAPAG